jgi:hypothetical protein
MSVVSSPTDDPSQEPAFREVFGIEELSNMVLSNLSGVDLAHARGVSNSWKQGCEFVATQADCGDTVVYPFSRPGLSEYLKPVGRQSSGSNTDPFQPHSLPMATRLVIDKKKVPELMRREDLWDILPNIRTVSIRPDPEEELGSELQPLLTVERSGAQRKLVFTPHRTMTQIMRSENRGIFNHPTITASWNIMLKPPKNEEEARLHESFYEKPRDVHKLQTTSDFHGPRYTNEQLEGTLVRLCNAGSAWNVKSISLEHNFEMDPDATYTSLAAKREMSFPFGSDRVNSLTYRAHRAHNTAGDRFCPTIGDCFRSPEFATACEGLRSLTIDTRGSFPKETYIPKTLKEMTFRYRVDDLPDASSVEAMASCLDKVDPEGSLTLKVECDFDLEVRGMNEASVASQTLEDHRLARMKSYERRLQEQEASALLSGSSEADTVVQV